MNDRISVRGLITDGPHEYSRVIKAIDATRFQIELGREPEGEVVLAAGDEPITDRLASRLRNFVRRGGGLVLLHGTLAAWSDQEAIREMAGWVPSGPGPLTELVMRPDRDHPVTQRLDAGWKVRDEIFLAEGPPVDAAPLIRASWRFTDQVVAYERRYGDGRFIHLGLGHDASTYADANFQKLLGRALMFAAGRKPSEPVGIGLIGYGAIARDHAASIAATPGLQLAGICDLSTERRELASREWSVRTHPRQEALLADPDVGAVVVGTPPSAHSQPVLAALHAGKHVVCEKPFALRTEEADRMIDAAASCGVALTVFQSRRWDPDFIAVREAVRSGRIGEVFYMESFIGGYEHPCDFWHSHEPISGGMIYDWGSHYFDWILQIFERSVTSVAAQAHKRVWHDVTNADQVRVDLTFDGGTQAMFLQSDIASLRKPKWYLLGTDGAISGEWADEPVPADFPARVKLARASGEEILALPPRQEHGFYRNLADHFTWGEPLAVRAEEARRNVAVMEAATESIRRGGARLEVAI